MKDQSWTLAGWSAIPVFLTLAVTPVATALVVSLPMTWLINHEFSSSVLPLLFGVNHVGCWQVVGLFAIAFAAKFQIKCSGTSNETQ